MEGGESGENSSCTFCTSFIERLKSLIAQTDAYGESRSECNARRARTHGHCMFSSSFHNDIDNNNVVY